MDLPGRHIWQQAFERSRAGGQELAWLAGLREAAMGVVADLGLPTPSDEDWRYTDLKDYARRGAAYLDAAIPAGTPQVATPALAAPGQVTLILRDGVLGALPPALPAGLAVASLRHADAELQADATALLGLGPADAPQPLVALNTGLLRDGLLLRTAEGAEVTAPVHIALLSTGLPVMAQPRLLVHLAPGSALTLVVEHGGRPGTLANVVTQVRCAAGARLDLVRAQLLPDDGYLTETVHVALEDDAHLSVTSLDLGAALARLELTVRFRGAGARADLAGAYLADGARHIDTQTRFEHEAPRTTSRQTFRGLADGKGRGICNGKIIVRPGATATDAALRSRGLLLAPTAELDTKPELEIYTDDVRCSHGATIGQLDANALFYLRSRGLDAAEARQVLISAFLQEVADGIGDNGLRARLEERLKARLAALGMGDQR